MDTKPKTPRSLITGGALAAAIALTVLMSGCSITDDLGAGGGSGTTGESTATDPESDGTDADSDGDADGDGALTGAACYPGNWYLDNDEFGGLIEGTSGRVVDNVVGLVMLNLRADGTATTYYDEWSHDITVDTATTTIVKNGQDEGTYEVAGDGSMKIVDTQNSSTTTATVTINGAATSANPGPQPSLFSQVTFTCAGDDLTATGAGGSTVLGKEH